MERRNARHTRDVVVPGDILDGTGMKPGENAYVLDGKVRASVAGIRMVFQNTVGVIPFKGCYMPKSGDTVLGTIVDIGPSNWLVDIGAPYPAPLHVNEVPWKVEFGDTSKYLGVGNNVLLKVLSVDESKKIQVTMKDSGLRRIQGGRVVNVPHSKVSKVIGKSGKRITMLKNMTDCRMTVCQNGYIWLDGDEENADVLAGAIAIIAENAQSDKLDDMIREFISNRLPQDEFDCYCDGEE